MRAPRPLPLARIALPALVALLACERRPSAAPADSAAPPVDSVAPVDTGASPVVTWTGEAGPLLVVQGGGPLRAALVFPEYTDSTLADTSTFPVASVGDAKVDLLARSGLVAPAASLSGATAAEHQEGCTAWPMARVATATGAAPMAWTVAFVAGRVQPLPLDSLEGMPARDSARFAADVARLANTVPDEDADFRGLAYVVRAAYRFTVAPGVEGMVADAMRRVNREANPRVEHLLLVAEREPAGPWRVAYHERAAGAEDTLEVSDVLAAVSFGQPPRPALVLARDYGDGTAYALVERLEPRRWRVRWTSAYTGC